jgi:tetratricopeptide (TPR) repeat protein
MSTDGASGLVYEAELAAPGAPALPVIVKECYPVPQNLGDGTCIVRKGQGLLLEGADGQALEEGTPAYRETALARYRRRYHASFARSIELYRKVARGHTSLSRHVFDANGTTYIVSDASCGKRLDEAVAGGGLGLAGALETLVSLCHVIGRYHGHGFAHLDLKPANILVTSYDDKATDLENRVRLFDFDTVAKLDAHGAPGDGAVSASGSWSAPELAEGRADRAGRPSDVYSLGAILYWLATGRAPTGNEVIHARGSWELPEGAAVDPALSRAGRRATAALCRILDMTLVWEPERRCKDTASLIDALEGLAGLVDPRASYLLARTPASTFAFTGRDSELKALEGALGAHGYAWLSGEGGMGKSALAEQYAYLSQGRYTTYVRLDYQGSVRSTIESLPVHRPEAFPAQPPGAGMLAADGPGAADPERLYRDNLALLYTYGKDTLLLIDNLDGHDGKGPAHEDAGLADVLSLPCDVIVTARPGYRTEALVEVGRMAGDGDLLGLFRAYRRFGGDEQGTVLAILGELGHNTLCAILAAGLLDATGLTAEGLLRALESEEALSIPEEVSAGKGTAPPRSDTYRGHLARLLRLSRLDEGERSVLANMTLVPRTGIGRAEFKAWCRLADLNAFNSLVARHLISEDASTNRCFLQPQVSAAAALELGPDAAGCEAYLEGLAGFLEEAVGKTWQEATDAASFGIHLSRRSELGMNTWTWQEATDAASFGAAALRRIKDDEGEVAFVALLTGKLYFALGQYDAALEYSLRALDIFKRTLPKDHPDLATSYNNAGTAYYQLAQYGAALKHYLKSLGIFKRVLPKDHPGLATGYNNVGLVYLGLGQQGKALKHLLKALDIRKRVLPEDHLDLAASYLIIGAAYNNLDHWFVHLKYIHKNGLLKELFDDMLSNRWDVALKHFHKALAILERALPEGHLDLAGGHIGVCRAYSGLGQWDKALEHARKALDISKRTLPDDHPDLAICYSGVGLACGVLGQWDEALEHFLKALNIHKRTLSEDHPDLATGYNNVGFTYRRLGQQDKAEEYFRKAKGCSPGEQG